ncbi:MAG TPA: histidinol dehydrogenase [Burkholderiales bacterium]|nr:histidinol dehydrogenase [Burkholderiales bacterium]
MAKLRRLSTRSRNFEARFKALLAVEAALDGKVDAAVAKILAEVKKRGDTALLDYTRRFDRLKAKTVRELELPRACLAAALLTLPNPQRQALEEAATRIRAYHKKQLAQSWSYRESDGTRLGQQVTPLDRVGMYVPGGKAAYPSTVLMNAIPAKLAGVRELIMTVPTPNGESNDLVLAAAAIAGVDRVFTIGGAQAIGALAYGTQTIPQVDKIVGPGNAYVAAAKRRVFGVVGIDMIAGPSEILVICDGKTSPDWVAMDLFSQAEHDEMAQAILLCPDGKFIEAVAASVKRLLPAMPRMKVIRASLEKRGALIEVKDLDEACEIANRVAPEHLELSVENAQGWAAKIKNAGAIFIGRYSSEALGDYCAGPNHVLPTSRSARFSSPLGVYDFQKRSSLIEVSREGAVKLGKIAAELAAGEGLPAHAQSAQYRMK